MAGKKCTQSQQVIECDNLGQDQSTANRWNPALCTLHLALLIDGTLHYKITPND